MARFMLQVPMPHLRHSWIMLDHLRRLIEPDVRSSVLVGVFNARLSDL